MVLTNQAAISVASTLILGVIKTLVKCMKQMPTTPEEASDKNVSSWLSEMIRTLRDSRKELKHIEKSRGGH